MAGAVLTPPPFSRVVWILIVDRCGLRERAVALPLVCRFFRNLALPRGRPISRATREAVAALKEVCKDLVREGKVLTASQSGTRR